MASIRAQAAAKRAEAQEKEDALEARAAAARMNVPDGPRVLFLDGEQIHDTEDFLKELYAQGVGTLDQGGWKAIGAQLSDLVGELGRFELRLTNEAKIWEAVPGGLFIELREHPNGN